MDDNLQRYMPEYDDEGTRLKLAGFSREELVDLLLRAYKEKHLLAKLLDESAQKIAAIQDLLTKPSSLLNMPDIPSAKDLKRMMGEE